MHTLHVTSAIIRTEDCLLMVKQPDRHGLYWFIPGGVVEPGELISEALRREVREETGLIVDEISRLAYITQTHIAHEHRQFVAFVFEVATWHGELMPDDPDGLTHDAAFVPIADTLASLDRVLWDPMRAPLQAYLREQQSAGSVWQYQQDAYDAFTLQHRTP